MRLIFNHATIAIQKLIALHPYMAKATREPRCNYRVVIIHHCMVRCCYNIQKFAADRCLVAHLLDNYKMFV